MREPVQQTVPAIVGPVSELAKAIAKADVRTLAVAETTNMPLDSGVLLWAELLLVLPT